MQRCFHGEDIAIGTVELSPQESHHLCNVMRTRVGEEVVVLNGKGTVAQGKLIGMEKKSASIGIERVTQITRPPHTIALFQAVLKNAHGDCIVREATAIGVAEIIFFETQNTECRLGEKIAHRLTRWEMIAIEACKQSGNPFLPRISYEKKLEKIDFSGFTAKVFGGLSAGAKPLKRAIGENFTGKNIALAIGPEGDFSPEEYDFLRKNNFTECRLARNVLRSETAAIYALCVLDQLLANG